MGTQQCSQGPGSGAGPEWGWGSTGPAATLGFSPEEQVEKPALLAGLVSGRLPGWVQLLGWWRWVGGAKH